MIGRRISYRDRKEGIDKFAFIRDRVRVEGNDKYLVQLEYSDEITVIDPTEIIGFSKLMPRRSIKKLVPTIE